MHEGINRKYLVYKPSKINKNPPLVIYFHGSLGTGENMRNLSGFDFDYLANEYGFVVAYLTVMKTIGTTADEVHHILQI